MAIIHCKECGEQISSEAVACPKCGCPISVKKKGPAKKLLIIILIALFVLALAISIIYAVNTYQTTEEKMMDCFVQAIASHPDSDKVDAAVEYFNNKFAGTEKETAAVDMLKEAVIGHLAYTDSVMISRMNRLVDRMDTDNADVEVLREVSEFLENLPDIYDIRNSPSQFYGKSVAVLGSLEGVNGDRSSIWLSGFECMYNRTYFGADWKNNLLRNYGSVLAYGSVRKYSDSNDAYLQMMMSIDFEDYTDWETVTAIYDFINALDEFGYTPSK